MICMKCGRDTQSEEVFCAECLEDMRAHPVKVDTRVNITPRNVQKRIDSPTREVPDNSQAEIQNLKRKIRNLRGLLLCCILLLAAVLAFAGWYYVNDDTPAIGQNYSTVIDDTTIP